MRGQLWLMIYIVQIPSWYGVPRRQHVTRPRVHLFQLTADISSMLGRLLALFLITPVLELALLIRLGEWIGFWPTIGIIVATGMAGTFLARREGLSVWRRFNERLGAGGLPGRELLDGVIILIAGALLITPGVLSDVAGLVGLIPATRGLIRRYVNRRIQRAVERGSVHVSFAGADLGTVSRGDRDGSAPTAPDAEQDLWEGEPRETPRHHDPEDARTRE